MKNRYFITGATGFVGSNVVRKLVNDGQDVHVLVRNGLNWRLQDLHPYINVHAGNLCSQSLPAMLKEISPTIVFHFASYGAVPEEKDIYTMFEVNVKGVIHLLASLPETVTLFVNTGSSSEYGVKDELMKEHMIPEPVNDYAVSKLAATQYCQRIAKDISFPVVTMRLFSPYGPYEQSKRFVPHVISHIFKKKNLQLSSPLFVRDFIYIKDVVDAYVKAVMYRNSLSGQIINIGSGKEYTLGKVVKTAASLLEKAPVVSWDDKRKQGRQTEPAHWRADVSKAKNILRWMPKYSLNQGLDEMIEWMKEHMSYYEK